MNSGTYPGNFPILEGFTMGSNKLVYHAKKTLATPLVNTPLKLAITSGFHQFHCFRQNACRP